MIRTVLLWLALAAPAAAQDSTVDPHRIDRCLGAHPDWPMLCAGREADACVERYGGGSDMVVSACLGAEAEVWDESLNAAYSDVMALARARQTWDGPLYQPNSLTDALRGMQRAWIAYRDATCDHALALVAPFGSAAGPAGTECTMRETARQYF